MYCIRHAVARALAVAQVSGWCAAAAAQQPAQTPEVVVITATRSERPLEDLPLSVTVVPGDALRAQPVQSLDEALRYVPGVDLSSQASWMQHPTANSVSMRGLGGTRALVLLDGVPINDGFFGYVQWSRVPLEIIDRVEVVRGGASSLYGTYALGGVINVITRAAQPGTVLADASVGSFETRRGTLGGGIGLGRSGTLTLSASGFRTDGYNAVPPEQRAPLDIPTSSEAGSVYGRADFQLGRDTRAWVRASAWEFEQSLGTPLSNNDQSSWDVAAGVSSSLGARSSVEGNFFYQDSRFRTDNTDTPFGFPPRSAEFVQNRHDTPYTDFGASVQYNLALSSLVPQLSFGTDVRLIEGEDTAQIFNQSGTQIRTDVGRGKQRAIGLFTQASVRPAKDLELLGSLRWDSFKNYDGFDGNPGGQGNVPDKTFEEWSPRLSARYEIDPVALRAAAYRAFRAPPLDNLYRGFSVPGGIFFPNSQLDPEKLVGGEVGADFTRAGRRVSATLFYNEIEDLLGSRNLSFAELPPGFFFGTQNINVGKVRSQGLELEANLPLGAGFSALATYTYTDATVLENPQDPGTVGNRVGGIPRHRGMLALSYRQARWSGLVSVGMVEEHFSDNAQTLEVDSYAVVDASVEYAWSNKAAGYLKLGNLFDREYIAANSGFGPPQLGTPRNLMVGARLNLDL
jgi:outer membrane receptor protein involved in Fe transport